MGSRFSVDMKAGKQAAEGSESSSDQLRRPIYNTANDAVDFLYRSRCLQSPFTELELTLSASNLLDLDITTKCDPLVAVFAKNSDGVLEELGRTEVILNNLNPEWIEKVTVTYHFEVVQPLIFHVYDVDTRYHNANVKTLKLKDQTFLGEGSCVLSEIVTKQSRKLTLHLHNKNGHRGLRNLGTLTVHAEERVASKSAVDITFRCSHLENKELFSKFDPFLRISKIIERGESFPLCKTEVYNNLNPIWKPLSLSMQQFGSKDNPLVIECFDFNSNGNHALIGKLHKSVADLEKLYKAKRGAKFDYPSSHLGREKVSKGQLFVDQFCEKEQVSFLDYLSGGSELNLMVAVDFTASNGDPQQHDSLHHIDPYGQLNSYQRAIMEVGEVIQNYDADKSFPAWGFGGRIAGGPVSHCFSLDGTATGFEVEGVQGIMDAYSNALHNVHLSGPTLFGPVINRAAEIAGHSLIHNSKKYHILLIITNGKLTDLQETEDALVKASVLPLSVLIVGVGSGNFKQIKILDCENGQRLSDSTGQVAVRDNVKSGHISAVQALVEGLPRQFLGYMSFRDIKPLNFHADVRDEEQVIGGAQQSSLNRYGDCSPSSPFLESPQLQGGERTAMQRIIRSMLLTMQRSMQFSIDLRYAVPPMINIILRNLTSIGDDIQHWDALENADFQNNRNEGMSFMDIGFVFIGCLMVLLILLTSFRVTMTVQPIHLRAGDFSVPFCILFIASILAAPHLFWFAFLTVAIISPWNGLFIRMANCVCETLQAIPTLIVTCITQNQNEDVGSETKDDIAMRLSSFQLSSHV